MAPQRSPMLNTWRNCRAAVVSLALLVVATALSGCAQTTTTAAPARAPEDGPTIDPSPDQIVVDNRDSAGRAEAPATSPVPPAPAPSPSPSPPPPTVPVEPSPERVELPEGLVVYPKRRQLYIPAWVCLEQGWLEQVACSPGTREHESLVVVTARPSSIHAAMLLAGFEPGRPGSWSYGWETETFSFTQPTGSAVEVYVRYIEPPGVPPDEPPGEPTSNARNIVSDDPPPEMPSNDAGDTYRELQSADAVEYPIRRWIADHRGRHDFPADTPFIFAGSTFAHHPDRPDLGEHYVADMTGSIIGLVTFGDELIGYREVIADQAVVHAPEWEVNVDAVPPVNTRVMLIIRPWPSDAIAD